jgi:hypothetical protein
MEVKVAIRVSPQGAGRQQQDPRPIARATRLSAGIPGSRSFSLAAIAVALALLSCGKDSASPPADTPARWNSLPGQTILQGSHGFADLSAPDSVRVFPNLADELVDPDSPKQITATSADSRVQVVYLEPHVWLQAMDSSFTGSVRVDVTGNGVGSSFTLAVTARPDEPATWTAPLPDRSIRNIGPHFPLVVGLSAYASDPDDPLTFTCDSGHPYVLRIEDDVLFAEEIPIDYSGADTVGVYCNGVRTAFRLEVTSPFSLEWQNLQLPDVNGVFPVGDLLVIYRGGATTPYTETVLESRTHLQVGFRSTASGERPCVTRNASYAYSAVGTRIEQRNLGDFQVLNRDTETTVMGLAATDSLVYAVMSGSVYQLDASTLQWRWGSIFPSNIQFDYAGTHLSSHQLIVTRKAAGDTLRYLALELPSCRQITSTGEIVDPGPEPRLSLDASDRYLVLSSSREVRILDVETHAPVSSRTYPDGVHTTLTAIDGRRLLVCSENAEGDGRFDLLDLPATEPVFTGVLTQPPREATTIAGGRLYLVTDQGIRIFTFAP